jgi:hypothetical protein
VLGYAGIGWAGVPGPRRRPIAAWWRWRAITAGASRPSTGGWPQHPDDAVLMDA